MLYRHYAGLISGPLLNCVKAVIFLSQPRTMSNVILMMRRSSERWKVIAIYTGPIVMTRSGVSFRQWRHIFSNYCR